MRAERPGAEPAQQYRLLAAAQLQRIAGLYGCALSLIQGWVETGMLRRAARGSLIARRDEPCDGLLLVVEGAVALGRHLGQRDAHIYTYLGPGDIQGLVPLLDGGPNVHDLMAHEPSVLLWVPSADVSMALASHAELRQAFLAQLAHRSRIVYDRLFEAMSLPLTSRLARQLDFLAKFFGTHRPQGVQISIRVSQADLACTLGASRQQVNAELKRFVERGLIGLSRTAIVVHDAKALEASGYSNLPMTLKHDASPHAPREPARRRPNARSAGEGLLRGVRVLLVEDDDIARLLLSTQLTQAGAEVDEAENGKVAVDKVIAAKQSYDVIVMDEHMPTLSGAAATRRIRAHQAHQGHPPTPILCVSSDAGRKDTKRFAAAGMNAHLAKPFRYPEFVAALRALLV